MLMNKDINCLNFKGLFTFLERYHGAQAVGMVTRGLVNNSDFQVQNKLDPGKLTSVQPHHLIDPAYWVSNAFSLQLLANINTVVARENPLFIAGCGAVKEGLSKSTLFAGRLLGPSALIRQAARINSRLNRTKDVVVTRHNAEMVWVELRYRDGFRVTRDVCNWNLGIYTGLIRSAGVRRVHSSETRCVLRGDPCCEFHLAWKKAGPMKRISRGFLTWLVRHDIRQMIEEHEATLNERDQLISQLVRSEEKYRTLFEDSMEAMNLTRNGLLYDVNPSWLALHGYGHKSEVIDADIMDFIHPDDHDILAQRRRQWPDIPKGIFQIRDVRKDGTTVDVDVYSTPITVSGESMILTTIRDITAIRQAEQAREELELRLQRVEKMEAMGTLVGGVAHDLNNMLSGIVSYPELLLMQIPEESPLRGPVQTIHQTGKRAAAIVQDLLTMSRRGVMVREVLDLNALIESCLQGPAFEKMLADHPLVSVRQELADDACQILGSPIHLNTTVMNLIANALEAMRDGGVIRVCTENCTVDQPVAGYDDVKPGEYVKLTVADTGVGIAPEDLHRIFEPFYTKKKMGRGGTGLGMSVVWGAVKDHQGFIDACSTSERGTEFCLYFPMTRKLSGRKNNETLVPGWKGDGETILVVDDSREQREIAYKILTEMGFSVETVVSGEAALEYLTERSVDLVILDMIMDPGMDGLDTYKKIITIKPDQKTLIASGFSETERVWEAQRLGAGTYVRKPYAIETIARAVHGVFNQ